MGVGRDLWNQYVIVDNKHDPAGLASLYASDGVYTYPGGRAEGREAIRTFVEMVQRAFPDIALTTTLVIEEGDTFVAEWTWRAAHTGPFALPDGSELAATGRAVEILGVSVGEVKDGEFTILRDYFDNAGWMSAIGLMPGT